MFITECLLVNLLSTIIAFTALDKTIIFSLLYISNNYFNDNYAKYKDIDIEYGGINTFATKAYKDLKNILNYLAIYYMFIIIFNITIYKNIYIYLFKTDFYYDFIKLYILALMTIVNFDQLSMSFIKFSTLLLENNITYTTTIIFLNMLLGSIRFICYY